MSTNIKRQIFVELAYLRITIKQSSWIIVYPMFYHFNSLMREFADVRSFGDKSPYQLICILVSSSFPCTIWVCIIYLCSCFFSSLIIRFLQTFPISKFSTIIKSYCFEFFIKYICNTKKIPVVCYYPGNNVFLWTK